jgi:hypothetical protein
MHPQPERDSRPFDGLPGVGVGSGIWLRLGCGACSDLPCSATCCVATVRHFRAPRSRQIDLDDDDSRREGRRRIQRRLRIVGLGELKAGRLQPDLDHVAPVGLLHQEHALDVNVALDRLPERTSPR